MTLLEKYIAKVEEGKDKLPKRPCINAEMHTFGMCFHCEKSRGRNEALAEVQSLLPELIKEVVEETIKAVKVHGQGYVCKVCGGGGFNHEKQKNCAECSGTGIERWDFSLVEKKVLASLAEPNIK